MNKFLNLTTTTIVSLSLECLAISPCFAEAPPGSNLGDIDIGGMSIALNINNDDSGDDESAFNYEKIGDSEDLDNNVDNEENDLDDTEVTDDDIEDAENDVADDEDPIAEELRANGLIIYAVNPGYTVDKVGNTGEMIVLRNLTGEKLELSGWRLDYVTATGTTNSLFAFPENSVLDGEDLVLRLKSAPESELADLNYTKTLALKAGPLILYHNDQVVDEVCWDGTEDCLEAFDSGSPTTLVRNLYSADFEHVADFDGGSFVGGNYKIEEVEDDESDEDETDENNSGFGGGENVDTNSEADDSVVSINEKAEQGSCQGLSFSEILTYYNSAKSEQFIEFFNSNDSELKLDGCSIIYKKKTYALAGSVAAHAYFVYYPTTFSLTKNPTSSNVLTLVDTNGSVIDELTYSNGQKKGTSYAMVGLTGAGEEDWAISFKPTPGAENEYQQYRTCEEGKVINTETGNCVKDTSTTTTKTCGEGKYLNPLTGRCKSYATTTSTTKTCAEGYELNPATNRCKKIVSNDGADYAFVEPENYATKTSFIALWALIGIAGVAVVYLIWEFRKEIANFWIKLTSNFKKRTR